MRAAVFTALLVVLPKPALADTASSDPPRLEPDMYLSPYVRGFAPIVHAVQDVPGGFGFGVTQGWWGRGIRVGYNLEIGAAPCAICQPYSSSWITIVFGADVSFDMWRSGRWSLVGAVRPRAMLAAVNSSMLSEVPIDNRGIFEPQVAVALWRDLTSERARLRGFRAEWTLELEAEEWIRGRDASPAIGLALGFVFGGCC